MDGSMLRQFFSVASASLPGQATQFHRIRVVEQVAVEIGDRSGAEHTALGHLPEQVSYGLVEQCRVPKMLTHDLGERGARKQPASSA